MKTNAGVLIVLLSAIVFSENAYAQTSQPQQAGLIQRMKSVGFAAENAEIAGDAAALSALSAVTTLERWIALSQKPTFMS